MSDFYFVFFGQPPRESQPAEATFDNPSFGQHHKALHAQHLTNHLQDHTKGSFHLGYKITAVKALVSQYFV